MKNLFNALLVFSILIAIAACSTKKENLKADENQNTGARLFAQSCQTCHILPKATMKTDEEWPALVARYGPRANLNKAEIAAITEYLISNN